MDDENWEGFDPNDMDSSLFENLGDPLKEFEEFKRVRDKTQREMEEEARKSPEPGDSGDVIRDNRHIHYGINPSSLSMPVLTEFACYV